MDEDNLSPWKTKKPCRICGVAVSSDNYCESHKSKEGTWGKRGEESRNRISIYKTKRWKQIRMIVIREQPICATPGCNSPSDHVDHIISIARGGAVYERENLQGLCASCHSKKTINETYIAK